MRQTRVTSVCEETSPVLKRSKTAYTSYFAEDRACIGKCAAEHGSTKVSRHFSSLFERPVPESTACLLKTQYLMELKNKRRDGDILEVKSPNESAWPSPSANWHIGSLDSLSQKPEIVING